LGGEEIASVAKWRKDRSRKALYELQTVLSG
jgi:hypothetical protein